MLLDLDAQRLDHLARHARGVGAYTVAFCPFGTDGDSSGECLFKEVDDAFYTYSDESEGVITIENFDKKICPLSGLTGSLVHWMLMAQWADHMARRGEMPYFMTPLHVETCRQWWYMILPYAKQKGWGLDQ